MTFTQSLDRALHDSGYAKADSLWHLATDALLARNYHRFDALMHEIRAITKTWDTQGTSGVGNHLAANNRPERN